MPHRNITQLRSLISIEGNARTIIIAGNKFNYNVVVKGAINLFTNTRVNPVVLLNNVFERNVAYFGTSALFIRAKTS